MGIRDEFAGSFARLSPERAAGILTETWGIERATLERLDTERDDSFHVITGEHEFVLKVAHPADDPLYVNLQTAAMSFAAELEPRLPLQRVVLSRTGEVEPVVDGRVARLLTWLPGIPVFDAVPMPAQLELLGETLGRLSSALSTFDHPAAHRDFVWDAARLHLVESLREEAPWPEIDLAFALADPVALAALPQQVIHNDFHPGNVLVDPGHPDYVTGVLDFGDVVHTARIVDLAVALSYLRSPLGIADTSPFVEGFERMVRVTDAERAALPGLVAARFAQRILINLALTRGNPGFRDSAVASAEQNWRALAALLEEL
jgi:hydroxylysine kinase